MLPNPHQPRIFFSWLMIAACLFSQWVAKTSAEQNHSDGQHSQIAAANGEEFASASVKDSSDLFRLTRRQFCDELSQLVVISSRCLPASSIEVCFCSPQQILSEFARRVVAGVLLN